MSMRIADLQKGTGPEVSPQFRRGDSFVALDGDHAECVAGEAYRQVILGIGVRIRIDKFGKQKGDESILLRCSGCLKSYFIAG